MTPQIYPSQPRLTRANVSELIVHLGNAKTVIEFLRSNPDRDTLVRCVLIELERARYQPRPLHSLNRGVMALLRKRIEQLDASVVEEKILTYLNRDSLSELD